MTLSAYLIAFIFSVWTPRTEHRRAEMIAIVDDVLTTDATVDESLQLLNIAALESNFSRTALGKLGERGAFQIRPPAASYGAGEALRRLRAQGIAGYVGCANASRSERCLRMVANRTWQARLWRMGFEPPKAESGVAEEASAEGGAS